MAAVTVHSDFGAQENHISTCNSRNRRLAVTGSVPTRRPPPITKRWAWGPALSHPSSISLSPGVFPSASNYVLQKQTDTRCCPWSDNINLSLTEPPVPQLAVILLFSQTSQSQISVHSAHCLTSWASFTCLQCTFSPPRCLELLSAVWAWLPWCWTTRVFSHLPGPLRSLWRGRPSLLLERCSACSLTHSPSLQPRLHSSASAPVALRDAARAWPLRPLPESPHHPHEVTPGQRGTRTSPPALTPSLQTSHPPCELPTTPPTSGLQISLALTPDLGPGTRALPIPQHPPTTPSLPDGAQWILQTSR